MQMLSMRSRPTMGRRTPMNKSYSELIKIPTFEERFEYLKLEGKVGAATFGYERYLNQILYNSKEWKDFRNRIIIRDNGCDLAFEDRDIPRGARLIIHHINPITVDDILSRDPCLFDPENVITTIKRTHDAIHYGDASLLYQNPVDRKPNDTVPWR